MTATDDAALRAVYAQILARTPEHDLVPSLDRIRALTDLLGDPQRSFRTVQVTGTNGKTSTTRMIERLLREHGLRTGRFTSPHLHAVTERIAVDGDPLPGERFAEVYREIEPYLNLVDAKAAADAAPGLTFFEVLVALAYAAFADAPVDVAAVEVGMGGSWDATSVVDAEVAVLTPISLDHQHFLGDDLSSVAREKAGIIRPGRVAVLGRQPEQVVPVLRDRLAEVGATAVRDGEEFGVLRRDVAVGGQLLTLQGLNAVYEDVFLPLHGVHQAHNAACALAAVETLLAGGAGLDGHVVEAAFAGMDSPGRMELLRRSPALLADAAHNPAGAAALADAVEESFNFDPLVGVIGVLTDKDALGILVALDGLLDSVVITRSSSPRSMDVDDLAAIAVDVFGEDRVEVVERLDDAIDVAVTRAESDGKLTGGVLLTGSITLVADARVLLGRA